MERILVIQTAFAGDAILTLPMIQKLSERNNTKIDAVAIPSTAEIFLASPYVNEVFILKKKDEHKSLLSAIKFAKELKKKNYSLVVSPHRSFRSALLSFFISADDSVCFDKAAFSFLYKRVVPYDDKAHEVKRNLDLIGFDGDWKIQPEIKLKEEPQVLINLKQKFRDKKIAAIAPASVWETKKYPKEYFEEIISRLKKKNYFVAVIGGQSDAALCESFCGEEDNQIINLCGKLSIPETVEFLRGCALLISNDSAPTHMGVAAGIPTVTLFCSTIPDFGFYPYHQKGYFLSYDELECKPCGIHGLKKCPTGTFDCGKKLTYELVINKIDKMEIE
ncbi:MAG: glycosyltransferase family 9 protein [Chlorobi bacterium]|nr:glycosyltransferase family 9 protein [Chlorobiota bacterium]